MWLVWCVGSFEVVSHVMHHQYQERVLYVTLISVSWLKISDKQTTLRNSECDV